jgi:hypothetical protein
MAATGTALLTQINGTSWATAFPQVGGPVQNLDIINIIDQGGNVILNVDYNGVVHNPASAATGINTRLGQYESSIASGTTAAIFAATFTNASNQDILQVLSPTGGSVANYLDYLGVSH